MAYHPKMDGMAKVTNHTMEQLLHIHAMTDGWVAMLPLLAMIINATPWSPTGTTPHEVAYVHKLRLPMDIITIPMTVPAAEEYVTRMKCVWQCVQ